MSISALKYGSLERHLNPGTIKILVNLIFFQIVWFATVYGPSIGLHWLGLPAIIIFAAYHFSVAPTSRADVAVVAIATAVGFALETMYVRSGILIYAFNIPSAHVAPYWILFLWMNFALTLNTGLRWLQDRHTAAAILGFFGAPIAYFTGVKLGAATIGPMPIGSYLAIAISWAIVAPLLLYMASVLARRFR